MLPEEAEPDVVWALEQLRERTMPQNAILDEFNKRLADRGIAAVSKSAWSRYAVRKAIQFRKLDEVQRMSGELVASLGSDGPGPGHRRGRRDAEARDVPLLEEGSTMDSKGVMELARALSSAVSAQKRIGGISPPPRAARQRAGREGRRQGRGAGPRSRAQRRSHRAAAA
jgi:hypothetical protein